MTGEPAVLLVPPQLRQTLARFMRSVVPEHARARVERDSRQPQGAIGHRGGQMR